MYKRLKDFNFHQRNLKRDEGFVLVTALVVAFLIVSIVASVILITAADLNSNAKQRQAVEARFAGESFADTIFAQIAGLESVEDFYNEILSFGGWQVGGGQSIFDFFGTRWFRFDQNGALVECGPDDFQESCFTAQLLPSPDGSELILTIVVRSNCNPSFDNCTYRQFEQRFSLRKYIDKVLISNSERAGLNVSPLADFSAYLPGDNISGSIHTNDPNGFRYCGDVSPFFNSQDFSNPNSTSQRIDDSVSNKFCGSPISLNVLGLPPQFLPGPIDNTGQINSASFFQEIAGPDGSMGGSGTITIVGNRIEGSYTGWPANGVLYVPGSLVINQARYSRPLTVYATGDITIQNDVIKLGSARNVQMGIASGQNIRLSCNDTPCEKKRVDAVLAANSGKVWNPRWSTSPIADRDNPPVFTLNGAIISDNRAVFGSYESTSDNKLVHGWEKDLNFQTDLEYNQPPFFFRTNQSNVARSSINEGPCRETFCN